MTRIRVGSRASLPLLSLVSLVSLTAGAFLAAPALAQPPPAAQAQGAPAAQAQGAPDAARPGASQVNTNIALPEKSADPLAAALAAQPGGLTPDDVARRAMQTRRSLRARQADLRAAQARVDQALVAYFPRVTATASYTRLSEVPGLALPSSPAIIVLPAQGQQPGGQKPSTGPLLAAPCQGQAGATCVYDKDNQQLGVTTPPSFAFPTLNSSYSLTAQLAVPVSDYVLRISQGYAAASHAASAKELEVQAETLQVASDAKIAFFNWARARGQATVAAQSVDQARAHVDDAKIAQAAGLVSRADVLRIEAQVASAEQVQAEAQAFESVASEQLRIVIQAPSNEALSLGIDILASTPGGGAPEALDALQRQALQRRLEIRALDETQHSLKNAVSLAQAAYFPRLDAFANLTYANPNQRIFPSRDEWNATWEAGLRMTWTINDTFTAMGSVAEAKARADMIAEQKAALMEGLRIEVASALADLQRARASIEAAERGLAASEESLRVRQLLFRTGRATSLDLVDAESEATRARLRRIDAHVGLLVAQTRLAHATGRDVPQGPKP
jgi:outer membrane protein TolC